jgi:hypothetical protein
MQWPLHPVGHGAHFRPVTRYENVSSALPLKGSKELAQVRQNRVRHCDIPRPSGTSPCWLRLQRSRHKPPQCWHVVCVVQRWDRLKVARLRDMGVVLFLVGEIRQGFLEEKPFLLTPDDNCEPGQRRYLVPRGTFWEASHCRAPS